MESLSPLPPLTAITKVFLVKAEDSILGVFDTDKAARNYMAEQGFTAAFVAERYAAVTHDCRAFLLDPNEPDPYQVGTIELW